VAVGETSNRVHGNREHQCHEHRPKNCAELPHSQSCDQRRGETEKDNQAARKCPVVVDINVLRAHVMRVGDSACSRVILDARVL
jgi:hypothetical protein